MVAAAEDDDDDLELAVWMGDVESGEDEAVAAGESDELAWAQEKVERTFEAPEEDATDDDDDLDSLPDLQSQSESEGGSIFGNDDGDLDSLPDLETQSDSDSGHLSVNF